jgi:hypothetical protein
VWSILLEVAEGGGLLEECSGSGRLSFVRQLPSAIPPDERSLGEQILDHADEKERVAFGALVNGAGQFGE